MTSATATASDNRQEAAWRRIFRITKETQGPGAEKALRNELKLARLEDEVKEKESQLSTLSSASTAVIENTKQEAEATSFEIGAVSTASGVIGFAIGQYAHAKLKEAMPTNVQAARFITPAVGVVVAGVGYVMTEPAINPDTGEKDASMPLARWGSVSLGTGLLFGSGIEVAREMWAEKVAADEAAKQQTQQGGG